MLPLLRLLTANGRRQGLTLQMRAPYQSLPHQVPHFAVLKVDFMSLNPVSLKLLTARNMRLVHNLQGSLEFPGIWHLPWCFGRRGEQSQRPKSLFTLLPPRPSFFRTYPFPPKPSLHGHDVYLLVTGSHCHSLLGSVSILRVPGKVRGERK